MKIIVVGLGRMGRGLAQNLQKKGHRVSVIDSNPDVFEALGANFDGIKVTGIGFDKDVLKEAKIDQVDALVACTSSDEANVVIARIAKNIFKVPHVVARLYDPRKAEIYHRLGIQTISTTTWGIERATEMLTYNQLDSVYEIGSGNVNIVRIEVPSMLVGRTVNDLTATGEINIVALNRNNKAFIPTLGTILEEEDTLYVSVIASASNKLKKMLGIA